MAAGALGFSTSRLLLHRDNRGILTPGALAAKKEMLVRENVFCTPFYTQKPEHLPRQARDRDRKKLQKEDVFLQDLRRCRGWWRRDLRDVHRCEISQRYFSHLEENSGHSCRLSSFVISRMLRADFRLPKTQAQDSCLRRAGAVRAVPRLHLIAAAARACVRVCHLLSCRVVIRLLRV